MYIREHYETTGTVHQIELEMNVVRFLMEREMQSS